MRNSDPRIDTLHGLVDNLREHPADQSDEVLAAASVLAAELKGLADTERLHRATSDDYQSDSRPHPTEGGADHV